MNDVKRKSTKNGVYFFSAILVLQLFFQTFNFLNDKEVQLIPFFYILMLIFICKYYYRFEDFLKKRKWV